MYLHSSIPFYHFYITLLSQSALKYIGGNIICHVKTGEKIGIENLSDFQNCMLRSLGSSFLTAFHVSCTYFIPANNSWVLMDPWSF